MIRTEMKARALRRALTGAVAIAAAVVAGAASAEGFGQFQTLLSGLSALGGQTSMAASVNIPEPDSLALLGIAVVGLLVARKRK